MSKKVCLISLGCAKNLVDSENMLGLLDYDKFEIVNDVDNADLVIVNTCGFIEPSKKESLDTIFSVLEKNKKVVVTGCLAQRYYDDLKKLIPEVSLFIPIRKYDEFNKLLEKVVNEPLPDKEGLRDSLRILSTPKYSAYLKIGEGCDNRCTYCAIPLIRGGFVSRPYDEIIKEAKHLASNGVREIIVLEQDTTKYGIDLNDGHDIVSLLKGLLEIKGLDYIRLLYLYPDEISDELIDLIAKEKRLTSYFDIPIQHSESHVLKDMNRRGDREFLLELLKKIKKKVPNAVLRTTIMVGFPGETEQDIDRLLDFMNEVEFDHVGAFTFSKEEGTRAFDFENQIDEEIKKSRLSKVMREARKISYKKNKSHINEIMEGLVVGKNGDDYLLRSYWNAPDDVDGKIIFSSDKVLEIGTIVKVKITNAYVYDLVGELVDE